MSQITQKGATSPLALTASGLFQQSTDANLATLVGARWDLDDGREVILVSTPAATTTVPGDLYQDAALIANEQGCVTTAFTAYSANGNIPASVVVTLGSTQTCTVNQFQGGLLVVTEGTGLGQTLGITGNTAATAANSYSTTVTLEDAPNTALVAGSSKVSLMQQHGANIVITPGSALTGAPVGIALYPISPSSYGFLLARGITGALSDSSAPAAGLGIIASAATGGAIGALVTSASSVTGAIIGNTVYAAASGKVGPIFLNL